MQCRDAENCPAKDHPDIPCWELAEKPKNSQCVMNICFDCIVHVIKTDDPKLTPKEVDDIIEYRNNNKTGTCPVRKKSTGKPETKKKKAAVLTRK